MQHTDRRARTHHTAGARTPLAVACVSLLAALAATPLCAAQDENASAPSPGDTDPELTFQADPAYTVSIDSRAWFPALQGNLTMPGGTEYEVESVDIDEVEPTPAFATTFHADSWSITLDGFINNLDTTAPAEEPFLLAGDTVSAGDPVHTDLSFSAFEATFRHDLYDLPLHEGIDEHGDPIPSDKIDVSLDALGGARLYSLNIDQRVRRPGGASASFDGLWADAFAGFGLEFRLFDRASVLFNTSVGGGPSSFSWNIENTVVIDATPNISGQVGFRHMSVAYEEDDFEFNGAIAGLFAGLVIRF